MDPKQLLLLVLGAMTFAALGLRAQCHTDMECKGERICEDGICVSPPSESFAPSPPDSAPESFAPSPPDSAPESFAPAPPDSASEGFAPAPPDSAPESFEPSSFDTEASLSQADTPPALLPQVPPPSPPRFTPYRRVQFAVQSLLGVGSFGERFGDSDIGSVDTIFYGTRAFGGAHVSTLFAGPRFHIGPYVRVAGGKGARVDKYANGWLRNIEHVHFGAGISMRYNVQMHRRVQIGGATDVGFSLLHLEQEESAGAFGQERYAGLEIFPRFEVEVFLFQQPSGFKMSVPISFGINMLPFSAYRPADKEEKELFDAFGIKLWVFQAQPIFMVGITQGK